MENLDRHRRYETAFALAVLILYLLMALMDLLEGHWASGVFLGLVALLMATYLIDGKPSKRQEAIELLRTLVRRNPEVLTEAERDQVRELFG